MTWLPCFPHKANRHIRAEQTHIPLSLVNSSNSWSQTKHRDHKRTGVRTLPCSSLVRPGGWYHKAHTIDSLWPRFNPGLQPFASCHSLSLLILKKQKKAVKNLILKEKHASHWEVICKPLEACQVTGCVILSFHRSIRGVWTARIL